MEYGQLNNKNFKFYNCSHANPKKVRCIKCETLFDTDIRSRKSCFECVPRSRKLSDKFLDSL